MKIIEKKLLKKLQSKFGIFYFHFIWIVFTFFLIPSL